MLRWSHPCLLQLSPTNHAKITRLMADVLPSAKHECRLRPYWQAVKREFAAKPSDSCADECLMSKIFCRQRLTSGDAREPSASGETSAPDPMRPRIAPLRGRFPTPRMSRWSRHLSASTRTPHEAAGAPIAGDRCRRRTQSSINRRRDWGACPRLYPRRRDGPAGRPEAPRQVCRPADKHALHVELPTYRMAPRQIALRPRCTAGRASSASSQRRTFGNASIAMPCLPWNFAQVSAAMSAIEYASARYSWSASRRSRTP